MSTALLAVPRRIAPLALALAVGLTGCDSSPSDPNSETSTPAVIAGGIQFAGGGGATAQDLSGVEVVVEADGATDVTDANGSFRVVTTDVDGQVRLRFRKGAMDVTLDLSGITAGTMFTLTVTLSDTSATVSDSTSSELDEFEGEATFVSVTGAAPNRTLSIEVTYEANRRYAVDVGESTTTFEADGDLLTFEALLARVQASQQVRVEGDGNAQSDGRVVATSIKAETDDDDDGDDDEDFEGDVTDLAVSGVAPARTARVTLVDDSTATTVDIVEGTTVFDTDGDILTFEAMLSAHASGAELEVEGDGELGPDGVWTARFVEVETDDDGDDDEDDEDNDDEDFEGDVTAVSVSGTAPARTARLTLVDDSVTTVVDIIEGTTVFDSDGDITTFEAMLAAHASGQVLEVEGEGDLGQDGVWTARTVEVEID